MRAIIIDDKDARALLDRLNIAKFDQRFNGLLDEAITHGRRDEAVELMHRAFHFEVTRWLQEQGASVIR